MGIYMHIWGLVGDYQHICLIIGELAIWQIK